jgi:hypothetical protein
LDRSSTASWYWQTSGATDTGAHVARFTIPSAWRAGCYSLMRDVVSRAYNPGTARFNPSAFYWQNERRRREWRRWAISVVDL